MKPIKVNYFDKKIILSSSFAKRAFIHGTNEYDRLQEVRRDFPNFELETHYFRKNTSQERYKGLTYDYMRWYIQTHESKENVSAVLADFEDKLGISKAHSIGRRYPTVKSWFLDSYPAFAEFGMTEEELIEYKSSRKNSVCETCTYVSNSHVAPSAEALDKVS